MLDVDISITPDGIEVKDNNKGFSKGFFVFTTIKCETEQDMAGEEK